MTKITIGYRYWSEKIPFFYIQDVKGRKGDWGYTTDSKKAIGLSQFHQIRFASDCRAVGVVARFLEISR